MQVKQSDRECAREREKEEGCENKEIDANFSIGAMSNAFALFIALIKSIASKYVILKEGCWQNHTPFGTISKF